MKNDLFFMTIGLLNIWKQGSCKDYCACILCDKECDDYKIFIHENEKDQLSIVLDVFGDVGLDQKEGVIYLTKTPSPLFLKCAKLKEISKICFIETQRDFVIEQQDKDFLSPFRSSFGLVIDILSQFKPIERVKA